jgi:hypothetical protein
MILGNPFLKRAAEDAVEDNEYLELFAPIGLDRLVDALRQDQQVSSHNDKKLLWRLPLLLESTPGGGKTTLLRLFTPGPLHLVSKAAPRSSRYEIRQKLIKHGVLNKKGQPLILGIYHSCSSGYESLMFNNVPVEGFKYLLDIRILIAAIRGVLTLANAHFPQELNELRLELPDNLSPEVQRLAPPADQSGRDFYLRLSELEEQFLLSLDWSVKTGMHGHRDLLSLELLSKARWIFKGKDYFWKPVLFLDNLHALAPNYWESLRNIIPSRKKLSAPIWFGIRSQLLDIDELLTGPAWEGTKTGRDYMHVHLDPPNDRKTKRFYNFVLEVANKRMLRAPLEVRTKVTEFVNVLSAEKDEYDAKKIDDIQLNKLKQKCIEVASQETKFISVVQYCNKREEQGYEKALILYKILIWLERERNRSQKDMFGGYESTELTNFLGKSDIQEAAELFLAKYGKLPYFYGEEKVIKLANKNVEQFLRVAGALFERVMSKCRLNSREHFVNLREQDTIIRKLAQEYWKELPRYVQQGERIQRFLEIVGEFCQEQTYRTSAPYAPGVTGIAISMSDYENVLSQAETKKVAYRSLAELIRNAVASKLLLPSPNTKCKNRYWLVLYLNRLLCVYFNLPLSYGGFKEQKLTTLIEWMEGRKSWKKQGELI